MGHEILNSYATILIDLHYICIYVYLHIHIWVNEHLISWLFEALI